MRSDRYMKIYTAAINNVSIDTFKPPLTKEEKEQYDGHRKWMQKTLDKAKKEGRDIIFDIPFDP